MAKFRIDDNDPGWSVELKQGDGFEKVLNATSALMSYTYDEIIFDKHNLILYVLYFLIAIVGACLIVYTCKCIFLCNSVRKNQNEMLQKKLSANKRKQE